MIRDVLPKDASFLTSLYNYYVENTTITFDLKPMNIETMTNKIEHLYPDYPFYVLEENDGITGYLYLSPFRPKPAYRYTAELTLYLDPQYLGNRRGSRLLEHLFLRLPRYSFRSLISVITLPNPESIGIHRKFGFEESGVLRNAGFKHSKWLDVVIYQKDLNQPSL